MKQYPFDLFITADQYLEYYRGVVRHVQVQSTGGQTVQFPAALLQKFITTSGISGRFVLITDDQNKVVELRRLG